MARRLLGLLILGAACLDNNPKFIEPGPTDTSAASGTTSAPVDTTEDLPPATVTTEQPTTDATTGSLATTTPAPTCPDGDVDADEECDDGNFEDLDACSNTCRLAFCGDGVTQETEECDDGDQDDLDECRNTCIAAECGDGVVQLDEACDDGDQEDLNECSNSCVVAVCGDKVKQLYEGCDDGNAVEFDGCQPDCLVSPKLVFVTSKLFIGDMGGLAGADAECTKLANDAGVPGAFVAWLSAGIEVAKTRVEPATVPYALRKGDLVALDFMDLVDGGLLHPIDQTETGGKPMASSAANCPSTSVYTSTAADGDLAQAQLDCMMFFGLRGSAVFGDWTLMGKGWTDNCADGCPASAPIYCFQQ